MLIIDSKYNCIMHKNIHGFYFYQTTVKDNDVMMSLSTFKTDIVNNCSKCFLGSNVSM